MRIHVVPAGAGLDREADLDPAPDEARFVYLSARQHMARVEARLTRAEREVAQLAIDGLLNAEIALARGTAERTIANQLAAIYKKLGVGSRVELIAALDRLDPAG